MSYGPTKIPARDIVAHMLQEIERHLLTCDAFSNPSLGYYGVDFTYTLEVQLSARQDSAFRIDGKVQSMGTPASEQVAAPADAIAVVAVAKGTGKLGQPRPRPQEGAHVISKRVVQGNDHGEEPMGAGDTPEQRAIAKERSNRKVGAGGAGGEAALATSAASGGQ